jgi:hypothetical protein
MKNTHLVDEEISAKITLLLLPESLISCLGNRLRKNLCQALSPGRVSVYTVARRPKGPPHCSKIFTVS